MQAVPVNIQHFGCEACGRITHLRAQALQTFSGACEHCGMWLSYEVPFESVHHSTNLPTESGGQP